MTNDVVSVTLPDPMPPEDLEKGWYEEYAYFAGGIVYCNPGHDRVRIALEDGRLDPDDAEEIARGLMAAARLARGKHHGAH